MLVAALALASLAACGTAGGSPTAAPGAGAPAVGAEPAGGPDPCALLHDDEAAALLRADVRRSGPQARSRGLTCGWQTADGNLLSVHVYQGRAFFAPEIQAPTGRRLDGVGDDAYVDDGVGLALVGETVVVVDAVGPGTHVAVESALRSSVARVRS
jgi:hypothetical protein